MSVERVHNHPRYRPVCNERLVGDQLRGSCLNDDGTDGLDHFWCHDPDVAYCGADLSETPEADFDEDGELMCVVCYDLQFAICQTCEAAA